MVSALQVIFPEEVHVTPLPESNHLTDSGGAVEHIPPSKLQEGQDGPVSHHTLFPRPSYQRHWIFCPQLC